MARRRLVGLALLLLAQLVVHGGARAPMWGSSPRVRLLPKFYEFGACRGQDVFRVDDYRIERDANGGEYLVVDHEFRKRMKTISRMSVVITRCRGGLLPNQCEYVTTWKWDTAVCQLAFAKGTMWSPIIESTSPTLKCPIFGRYHTANATYDYGLADKITGSTGGLLDKFIYIVQCQLFGEDRSMGGCYNVSLEMRRVRVRP